MKSYLSYWRNSLADAAKLSPSDDSVETAIQHQHEIKPKEFADGKLPLDLTEKLFEHSRARFSSADDDDEGKSIPAAVFPIVLARNFSHGAQQNSKETSYCVPLSIPVRLSNEGRLYPDDDRKPFLVRDLLAPSSNDDTIGELDDADEFYAKHPVPLVDWKATVDYARNLLKSVSDQSLEHLELEDWARLDHGIISVAGSDSFSGGLIAAYDRLIARDGTSPLITRLIDGFVDEGKLSHACIVTHYADHLGQMTDEYGLAPSQRESLSHVLKSKEHAHEILAINGPPGTGKTTMLQSVIATGWVEAALKNGNDDNVHCPIVVAVSSNNQAVTNVIDSFGRTERSPKNRLDGRWIKAVRSYGLFLPSSRADVRNRQIFRDTADHFAVDLESPEALKAAKDYFLECARLAFDNVPIETLSDASSLLHRQLRKTCDKIKEITHSFAWLQCYASHEPWSLGSCRRQSADLDALAGEAAQAIQELEVSHQNLLSFELDWADYKSNEPLWLVLLSSISFLKPIRTYRCDRDHGFLLKKKQEHGLTWLGDTPSRDQVEASLASAKLAMEELLHTKREASKSAEGNAQTFRKHLERLSSLIEQGEQDCPVEKLLGDIDRRYRYEAFQLATHYWEAKYLLEVENDRKERYVDKKSGEKRLRQFRRLAKLTPCFVSTVYKLPDYFTGWSGDDQPLWDEIDLLIVDEAGQTGIDIAAPSFAFAKRALIVGDTHQIAPIAKLPAQLDATNVRKFGVGSGSYERFAESGLATAEGSLMLAAQRACRFTMVPTFARGLLLREHRRCRDDIIAYCNALVYRGELEPRCDRANPPDLPPLGYAHVSSEHRRIRNSRDNVVEAETIALWIKDRKSELEAHYEKEIGDVLGVVTPFSPQVNAIKTALEKHGLPVKSKKQAGIVVGTTHALQGAERDVILFSPTYGRQHRGGTFFGRDETMLNVAVSRARDSFLIFGNMHLFGAGAVGMPSKVLGDYVLEPGHELTDIRPVRLTEEGRAEKHTGDLIMDLEKHRATIRGAFETAELEVVIVSPYITMKALESDAIEEQVGNATRRGIRVIVYTDEALNKKRWTDFNRSKDLLERSGAQVVVARKPGIHSKILWRDDTMLAVGSFNWLSAVRQHGHDFQRHETSALFRPPEAVRMIKKINEDLKEVSNQVT